MGDIVDASGKLSEGGMVTILLFLLLMIGGGVTIFVVSVYRQFFGAKTKEGWLPRLFTAHQIFLDRMAVAIEKVAASTEENKATSSKQQAEILAVLGTPKIDVSTDIASVETAVKEK